VIKKAARILVTAGLLIFGSEAYKLGFARVERYLAPPLPMRIARVEHESAGPATLSRSAQEARELAARAFGQDHWSASKELKIRFYDAQRGFWIYAQNYDPKSEKGDRIRFWPVVFIWRGEADPNSSNQRRNLIYGGGDEAIIDMSQPIGVIKPGKDPSKIVSAMLKGNVLIRDDKATPSADDDMEIGPLANIQFDEPTLSIKSDSAVRIKDRDLLITGNGLDIELWPRELLAPADASDKKSGQSSFTGTKTITLANNVRIEVANVGKSNVLPGASKDKTEAIPAWLTCDGTMRIDLPRQHIQPKVGPPRPAAPTIATFKTNVVLQRGAERPDRVTGDLLRAELFPTQKTANEAEQKAETRTADASKPSKMPAGPMTELDLKWARVTGNKVTLLSQAQGLSGQGTELILKRAGGQQSDQVYLRGSESVPLVMERVEYVRAENGQLTDTVRSIETMKATDITVFDEKPPIQEGNAAQKVASTAISISTVVAHGAGSVDVRESKTGPIVRSANWTNQAVLVTDGSGERERKTLTLIGSPVISDVKSGDLRAEESLKVVLVPRNVQTVAAVDPKAPATKAANPQGQLNSQSFEIAKVEAHKNVLLVAGARELSAKNRLDVEFLPGTTAGQSLDKPATVAVRPTAFWADQPAPNNARQNVAAPAVAKAAGSEGTNPAKKADDPVKVAANQIWAKLGPKPRVATARNQAAAGGLDEAMGGVELVEARLRGDVLFRQETSDPKKKPSNVEAQAVDIVHQGMGAYHLLAFHRDPTSKESPAVVKPVTVNSDQFDMEGPILGINQAASTAWVNGPGKIEQWIGSEIFKQEGFGVQAPKDTNAAPKPAAKPQKAIISWKKRMDFFGRPDDSKGGRANFYDGVSVKTTDAALFAGQLDIYFDRQIPLDQFRPDSALSNPAEPGNGNPAKSGNPQIQFVDAKKNVTIINRRRDLATNDTAEQQRIDGPRIMYDKARDAVEVDGAGIVRLWQRRENALARPEIGKTQETKPAAVSKPYNMTRVEFAKRMHGRLGYDPQDKSPQNSDRSADFFGNVQVLNAQVSQLNIDMAVDRPLPGYVLLTSEWLEVESLANPAKPKEPRNLIRAKGTATARSETMSTQGDEIHFDSADEKFHVVGHNGKDVTLVHQTRPGQSPSVARGKAIVYNNKTGESELVDPRSIQLVDPNSGKRPSAIGGPTERIGGTNGQRRTPLRLPSANDKERRSF
jgi:hypothetical protein